MQHPIRIALAGLALAVVIALLGRGGLLHFVGSVYLGGLSLAAAGVLLLLGRRRGRGYRRVAFAVAAVGVLALASLPLGVVVNQWDVARAMAWCERAAAGDIAGRRPVLARRRGEACVVHDRMSFMRWWEYNATSGEWSEVD